MSFWKNKEEYKVNLVDFTERFIAHNTCVKLYIQKMTRSEQGQNQFEYTLVWKGMDWQITEGYAGSEYFKVHSDVKPCPYSDANVIGVTAIGINAECCNNVSLIIEETSVEVTKEYEPQPFKPNTAVCTTEGSIDYCC